MSKGVPHGEAHRAEPEEAERNFKPNQQHQPHIDCMIYISVYKGTNLKIYGPRVTRH